MQSLGCKGNFFHAFVAFLLVAGWPGVSTPAAPAKQATLHGPTPEGTLVYPYTKHNTTVLLHKGNLFETMFSLSGARYAIISRDLQSLYNRSTPKALTKFVKQIAADVGKQGESLKDAFPNQELTDRALERANAQLKKVEALAEKYVQVLTKHIKTWQPIIPYLSEGTTWPIGNKLYKDLPFSREIEDVVSSYMSELQTLVELEASLNKQIDAALQKLPSRSNETPRLPSLAKGSALGIDPTTFTLATDAMGVSALKQGDKCIAIITPNEGEDGTPKPPLMTVVAKTPFSSGAALSAMKNTNMTGFHFRLRESGQAIALFVGHDPSKNVIAHLDKKGQLLINGQPAMLEEPGRKEWIYPDGDKMLWLTLEKNRHLFKWVADDGKRYVAVEQRILAKGAPKMLAYSEIVPDDRTKSHVTNLERNTRRPPGHRPVKIRKDETTEAQTAANALVKLLFESEAELETLRDLLEMTTVIRSSPDTRG